jgi:hypothetical protein
MRPYLLHCPIWPSVQRHRARLACVGRAHSPCSPAPCPTRHVGLHSHVALVPTVQARDPAPRAPPCSLCQPAAPPALLASLISAVAPSSRWLHVSFGSCTCHTINQKESAAITAASARGEQRGDRSQSAAVEPWRWRRGSTSCSCRWWRRATSSRRWTWRASSPTRCASRPVNVVRNCAAVEGTKRTRLDVELAETRSEAQR